MKNPNVDWPQPNDLNQDDPANAPPPADPNAFDESRVPQGIDKEWARDFIRRNPGDYDRLASAYKSNAGNFGLDTSGASASPYGGTGSFSDLLKMLMGGWQGQWAKNSDFSDKIRGSITDAINAANAPVNMQDPYISSQVQSQSVANQRSLARMKEAVAARAAAGGGPTTGASDAALQSGEENLGIAEANSLSNILAQEYSRRKNQLTSLLGMGGGLVSGDQAVQANQSLGALDALIKNNSVNNQNQQWYDNLAYEMSHNSDILNYLYAQLAGAA